MTDTSDTGGPGRPPGGVPSLSPEDRALAAEYALRLLGPAARADFEARLAYSRALRDEVAAWETQFAVMAEAEVSAVAPRPTAKAALMDALFGAAAAPARLRWWQRAGLWQATTAAALALAAGLGILVLRGPAGPAPLLVGEIAAGDDSLRLLVLYDGADGSLRLTRTDGAAPPGRVLELWAIGGPDAAPVSLGLLDAAGQGVATVPPGLRGRADALTLAISVEPPGGSPTGQPTGDVVAIGALAEL